MKRLALVLVTLVFTIALPTISQARQITMVTVDWAPHYGKDLPENGLTTALVKAAFKTGGHDANIEFIPWPRALKRS